WAGLVVSAGEVDRAGIPGSGVAKDILSGDRRAEARPSGSAGWGRYHQLTGGAWGDGEAGARRACQAGAGSGERVASARPVDGQVAEGGHAVDDAHARGAAQDSAARVSGDGDIDGGGTAGDGIAEAILDGNGNCRADGDCGHGVGWLL